jgi:hypothetical protein
MLIMFLFTAVFVAVIWRVPQIRALVTGSA